MIKRITRVRLENFQSHRDTDIPMGDGVVVLSGESNNGKTAVIRALQWLITNRPTGDGFVSHWAKHANKKGERVMNSDERCSVTVEFDDINDMHHVVSRMKKASENWYEVDGTKLSAIGTDVPAEVLSLMGMKGTNLQDQDDSYFMLNLSGSQVSSKLNELVHLDTIDTAQSYIKKRKSDFSSEYKQAEKMYYESKVIVDSLKHIGEVEDDYNAVVDMKNEHATKSDACVHISEILKKYGMADDAARMLPDVSRMDNDIALLTSLLDDTGKISGNVDMLSEIIDRYGVVSDNIGRIPDIDGIDISGLDALLHDYASLKKDVADISTLMGRYSDCVHSIESLSITALDADKLEALASAIQKYNESKAHYISCSSMMLNIIDLDSIIERNTGDLEEIAEIMPETCPLCGAPMEGHAHA